MLRERSERAGQMGGERRHEMEGDIISRYGYVRRDSVRSACRARRRCLTVGIL